MTVETRIDTSVLAPCSGGGSTQETFDSNMGIGMIVMGYDPFVKTELAEQLYVTLSPTLEALLSQADVVSLHVPLLPETRNLINADRIAQMKPGAILINVARGGIVDELVLHDALDTGRLSGAGLDVFASGLPPPDHPLLGRDDVIVTPISPERPPLGKIVYGRLH